MHDTARLVSDAQSANQLLSDALGRAKLKVLDDTGHQIPEDFRFKRKETMRTAEEAHAKHLYKCRNA